MSSTHATRYAHDAPCPSCGHFRRLHSAIDGCVVCEPGTGCATEVADPAAPWEAGRRRGTDEAVDAAAFEIGAREVACGKCFFVHPAAVACEEVW